MKATFKAVADHAVLVSFALELSDEAHASVIALDRAIEHDPPTGLVETVPAMVNLLVDFDPIATDHLAVQRHLEKQLSTLEPQTIKGAVRVVSVCYEEPFAPDLDAISIQTGLSKEEVLNAHLAGDYKVLMYGFSPGYAYLSGVCPAIHVPRKPTAVRDVAAGSVIIAGPQCLVTTLKMPTGWSIIGRSPTQILTGDQTQPFLFDVGDSVVFKRIDQAEFSRLSEAKLDG